MRAHLQAWSGPVAAFLLAALVGGWVGITVTELRQQQAAQAQILQQIIERSNQHTEQIKTLRGPGLQP